MTHDRAFTPGPSGRSRPRSTRAALIGATALVAATPAVPSFAQAPQQQKPNILFIVSDDTGYGDLGPYGGGEGRGMPTPNIDRLAEDGMTFFSFYAQPSCTPGRAAMQTGRIPNRSGMTTVAFQGQGGGLPAAEWTLGSVLKQGGYKTYFTGKWHLGEADYALPNAQGYDVMQYCGLYHLNAYTYADPTWFPDMDPELRAMFQRVTRGALSGKAGEKAVEDFKVNGQYVNTPVVDGKAGVVGIPFFDSYVEKAALGFLDDAAKAGSPFYINVNFMKVHQPNMPAPEFEHKSLSKSKYADSVVELDARIGRIMDKLRSLGLDKNTLVFYTTDNGAWQDVYPDAGYTPFRGTKGTVREGGNRVPAMAVWPGKIKPGTKNHDIVGGLDLMATFASVAGLTLPDKDRDGQPMIFDSYDMSPVLLGTGKSARKSWFYFTEDELSPGAVRVGNYKAVFNLRGDDGAATGALAVDTNLGWKGSSKYVATVPQIFDLWQDPQERYDVFMNNYTERTWTLVTMSAAVKNLMKTYVQYPPRKLQSEVYTGPITISQYERLQSVRDALAKEGITLPMPTGQ
ncbi:sulfatase [Methylobacterium sp. 4-46]|uniref:arylsulfatase n=1 Tax=unclassified Methylobacterium TaxID=2615210 RepID=UPI000152D622|nr:MULTISPECIES: arylsulfatase [Methylobacterium]ACA20998.1 sulfatase [Methylobacterium sp. 4-46]WFT80153.1 arylsulfatase [Methylobacterium nodulans]